ncbi:MAG: lipoprotein-releasing ABC transporter permease subunit [Pseudomonadota bacterium]|nr:lipoprotein-releasing ABC transporter permease subunit [Pseudomonadota bacterium]
MQFLTAYRFLTSEKNTGFISIISKISILGIILGVGVLITVMSVMNGFEKELRSKILGFTSHATIYAKKNDFNENNEIFKNLNSTSEVIGFSPYIQKEGLLSFENRTKTIFLRAIKPPLEKTVSNVHESMIIGKFDDLERIKNSIIIGSGVAQKLFVSIGDEVELLTQIQSENSLRPYKSKFIVSGIYDVGLYEYNNAFVFIKLESFISRIKNLYNEEKDFDAIRLKLKNPLDAYQFSINFQKINNNFIIQDWTQTHVSFFNAINNEKRIMFIILILIIVVAAFNITSSLLMLVISKQKDIAILMTLGANKSTIMNIFVLQGLLLGIIGTAFGIAFGLILSHNIDAIFSTVEAIFGLNLLPAEIYHLNKIPSIIDYKDVLAVGIASFMLSIFSTLYPARKAASIMPSKILRNNAS